MKNKYTFSCDLKLKSNLLVFLCLTKLNKIRPPVASSFQQLIAVSGQKIGKIGGFPVKIGENRNWLKK